MNHGDWTLREGRPFPRGASWDGQGVNFSLFSANATRVELCLFDADGARELARFDLPEYTDEVWHGYVAGLAPGAVYGYRVHGPYEPDNGHRFNPNKLLVDPYARSTVGALEWNPACFGYTIGDPDDDLSFDTRDSAPYVPKSVVVDPGFDWKQTGAPLVPRDRTILYELHVRGYTRAHPAVYPEHRGTFAGLAAPEVVRHVRSLGVTSIELLPIHTCVSEQILLDRGLSNYWGYNTLCFFAVDPRFCSQPQRGVREFKEMVAVYHDAGIEVILDVVYNHSAEGNEHGPTFCYRGIDNASYYRLLPERQRYYINDTGTGNTMNLSHPRVIQLVTDSLRYWVQEMHIDGFRFDLGTVLSREPDGFSSQSGFLKVCAQDPVLAGVKLIAEPWDCGPGGYQVGGFPPGWAEWNDQFRDTVRDFWRAETTTNALAPRLYGSADIFGRRGRRPYASINFVTAHDGFTLHDLVSYNERHNEANGEDNRDGQEHNRSWNCGAEGDTDDAAINELRRRQMRNLLATLFLSQGTPMLLAGDEFARTQQGNNNAYCQDNTLSWVDWSLAETNSAQVDFVRQLTALRTTYAILRRSRFLSAETNPYLDLKEISWINGAGTEMTEEDWHGANHHCFGMLLDGRAQQTGMRRRARDATLLILFNAHHEEMPFKLPGDTAAANWLALLDTRLDKQQENGGVPAVRAGTPYALAPRSLALFRLDSANPEPPAGPPHAGGPAAGGPAAGAPPTVPA